MAPGSAPVVSHGSDELGGLVAARHMREPAAIMDTSATPAYIRIRAELREALAEARARRSRPGSSPHDRDPTHRGDVAARARRSAREGWVLGTGHDGVR